MMYGRDESAPTPTVCLLILRNEWALWCVCWIMNDVWARWISAYVYGVFADITQWINLVVCLLDYEWCTGEITLPLRLRNVRWYYAMNKPCGVFVGLWMIVGRDESAPTPTVCSLLYIYALNKPCGVFVELWMMYGRDKSAPTSTECLLLYILCNK